MPMVYREMKAKLSSEIIVKQNHPCDIEFLTCAREPGGGQCQAGSLTGAVAYERVSEALKGSLRMVGNHPESAKA